jgi:hypothetical protein
VPVFHSIRLRLSLPFHSSFFTIMLIHFHFQIDLI